MPKFSVPSYLIVCGLSLLALNACSSDQIQTEAKYPTGYDRNTTGNDIYGERESIFGDGGLGIFGERSKEDEGTVGIGVNGFLWRAALDTVSFMPLASADPFGGTILTDWYEPENAAGERYKLNVFILSRQLRSDGIQVKVFKQTKQGSSWVDGEASADMGRQLEDAILTRARQMRIAQIDE